MLDFFNQANSQYIENLYRQYREAPDSIDVRWAAFFSGLEAAGHSPSEVFRSTGKEGGERAFRFAEGVKDLVNAYREFGHFIAKLNPLESEREAFPLLELSQLGFTESDLNQQVVSGSFLGKTNGTLRDLIEKLRSTYCESIGVEYMGIPDKDQQDWLRECMEPNYNRTPFTKEEHLNTLKELLEAEGLEQFVHTKFLGQKRFSLEGGEALIPLLNTFVDRGTSLGVKEFMMGMAHRGRLNVLAHVLKKPYELILSEFEASAEDRVDDGEGDVKYHLGFSCNRTNPEGFHVHCSMSPNPSHLEMIDPVIQGKARAKQAYTQDESLESVVPVLIHGEAAFTGQGIVTETLSLSQLGAYRTGGTLHVIVNNQLGFTAPAYQTRFTPYPTDVAKTIAAPIFHVNGDDPEAVVHVAKLAIEFRQKFKKDVFIDFWCYRKFGHNEGDDPTFTQPRMYKKIHEQPSVVERYSQRLIQSEIITAAEFDQLKQKVRERLDQALNNARTNRPSHRVSKFEGTWKGFGTAGKDWGAHTEVPIETLRAISEKLTQVPKDFHPHRKIEKLLESRREMGKGNKPVDWGCAESWAIGSLLLEETPVRLTGQDTERGTFSHRHAVWHDIENGSRHIPLTHLSDKQAPFTIVNTMLSELAVLGFEFGYSIADPRNLVVWEAQFGDFVNGAQPIIDLFIAGSESKWQRMSGIVLLLPHGYEGQGPEHSSARLERFLQLCADDNIQVAYPTLPAQYFHLLRRQIHRPFRKPLIVMTPKSLLRYPPSTSPLEAFTEGHFNSVLEDTQGLDHKRAQPLLLCSGKVYFSLKKACETEGRALPLIRIEQLYPFPEAELAALFQKYPNTTEYRWVQEEPHNMGAWTYIAPLLRKLLPNGRPLTYHGRDEAASPATGWHWLHEREEKEFIASALSDASALGASKE